MRFSEIADIILGQSPDSTTYNTEKNGLPFFQGNADFGSMFPKERIFCSAPIKIVQEGDVLLSVRAPIGAVNVANQKCCIGRGLAAIRPKKNLSGTKYLFYLLIACSEKLAKSGTGSTFKAINGKTLYELEIPVYSLQEQKNIVDKLELVDNLIAKRKQQLEKLDLLVKANFYEMFGDIISNSKGWPTYSFSDIAASRLGKMLDTNKQTGKESFCYLANFNVQWFKFVLKNLNYMDFSEIERKELELLDGDLLVCEGGEIGRCAIWHNELANCYFQKALHRVRCNTNFILPEYLAWWFKYNCDHGGLAAIEGAKATIAHLPGVKLKKLSVATPPLELQNEFAHFLEQTEKIKSKIKLSLEKLELLKQSLLQKYFG